MISNQLQSRIPGFSNVQNLTRSKGWPYIATWAHRISGVFLAVYLAFHIITLSSLQTPEIFIEKMNFFSKAFPGFLEWFLAIPVIYHSLNGGRLILYEIFGQRNDKTLLRSILAISLIYLFLLATFMVIGNQSVSPYFFWSQVSIASFCLALITIAKLKNSKASIFWKLQRISGAFLFIMIPAHMIFMHLDPTIGRDVQVITERMNSLFIKCIDMGIVISALYHSCYGLTGICLDYISDRTGRLICSAAIILVTAVLAIIGIKLTISI